MKKIIKAFLCAAAALMLAASLVSCGTKPADKRVVMTVGGEKVLYDEFRYVFLNAKRDFDGGDSAYWQNGDREALEKNVLDVIKRSYAIEAMAKDFGVELDNDDKEYIQSYISSFKKSFETEEEYLAALENEYMSEWYFKRAVSVNTLWQKLYDYVTDMSSGVILTDDAALAEDVRSNFYRAVYIYICNDEEDDAAQNRTAAETAAQRAENGEDFSVLVEEYNEDAKMDENPDGRYFTSGELLSFFEEAVKALDLNETSGVVEGNGGFYVIRRLPLDEQYIDENLETLRVSYMARRFNEMLAERVLNADVVYTDLFETLTVEVVK